MHSHPESMGSVREPWMSAMREGAGVILRGLHGQRDDRSPIAISFYEGLYVVSWARIDR